MWTWTFGVEKVELHFLTPQKQECEITKLLLEAGASVSARQYSVSGWAGGHNPHHCSGITPLHWAARKGHKQVVELLLQYGANPNARGTAGRAPIQEASCGNHIEIVKLLLSKKADVNAQSYYDVSPLPSSAGKLFYSATCISS